MFKLKKFVIITVLAVFVIFSFTDTAFASDLAKAQDRLTAKSSPKRVIIGAEFDHGLILTDYLTEGFETWFPPDWTRIITNSGYTWNQVFTSSYEGIASAEILYDPALVPQDEWMISPTLDFSNANNELQVEFYFLTSYYWHVDPFDNGDMQVRISTDDGDTWSEPLWTEDDYGLFDNWVWYQVILELDEYVGDPLVKIAFVYQGVDGAQANFDAIIVSDGEGPVYEHDIGVVEFVSPGQNGYVGDPITPEVTFGNFGANEETFRASVTISFEGDEVYEEPILYENLPVGGTTTISFPPFTPTEEGIYTLSAVSNFEEDENPDNDTLIHTYDTTPTSGFFEDFESGDGNFVGNNDWQHGVPSTGPPGGAYSGENLWGTLINGQYTMGPLLSTLTSPPITLGTDAVFSFWHWYHTENTFDGGNVKISPDDGSTWILITPEGGYDGMLSTAWENPIGGEQAFYGGPVGWVMETFDLSAYDGNTVLIKFDYGSDNSIVTGYGWYIDDFQIDFQTGIEDMEALLPSAFNLEQNYPNPFNASTEISFTLSKAADIDLSVYNMLGQKVAALASGMMDAGYHSVNWNASDVTSGIYFYRLTAGDNCEVRKMTLLK